MSQLKNESIEFHIEGANYFSEIVLGSKMTVEECIAEETHNVFDNDGSSIDIKLFDINCEIINYKEEKPAKYVVMTDDCPKSMKNPSGIMESLRKKNSEQTNSGVGNFNFGEIAAVFNLSTACIYLRSKIYDGDNIGDKFSIKLGEKGTPVMTDGFDEKDEELCNKLNLKNPVLGTVKLFILKDNNDIKPEEYTQCVSKMTNMKISYNDIVIEGCNYIKDSVTVKECHKFTEEIYGKYNIDEDNITWYSGDKNTTGHFSPLKSWTRWLKEELLKDSVPINSNEFDLKVKGYFTIWPSHDKEKFKSTPGLIFNQTNHLEKSVNLYNQEKTKKFMNWCLSNGKEQWSYQSPGKDSEYIFEMTILNKKYKSKIFTNLGYFAVKSRNASFYDSPQRIPFRFIITTLHDRYKEVFKKNTGKKSVPTAGISPDSHGNWWQTIKGKTTCISLNPVGLEQVQEQAKEQVQEQAKEQEQGVLAMMMVQDAPDEQQEQDAPGEQQEQVQEQDAPGEKQGKEQEQEQEQDAPGEKQGKEQEQEQDAPGEQQEQDAPGEQQEQEQEQDAPGEQQEQDAPGEKQEKEQEQVQEAGKVSIKDIKTTKVKQHRRGFYTEEEAGELIKKINNYYEKYKCIPVNIGKGIESLDD